jgi:ParB/RepB/Spo0J family partition protein
MNTRTINIAELVIGSNVRAEVGDITELAKSIEAVGLLSPPLARELDIEDSNGTRLLELVAGHRRLAALESLGITEVEVLIIGGHLEAERTAVQMVENLQREDLNPLEEAAGLAALVTELGTQAAAADAIGRSRGYVSKALKLFNLSAEAQKAVAAGTITAGDAYEVARLSHPDHQAKALTEYADGRPDRAKLVIKSLEAEEQRPDIERKAAKAVAGQKHRKGIKVMALTDAQAEHKAAKPIEGWAGISIDFDEHQAEPCNLLVVGFHQAWAEEPTEVFWCTDPTRHEPNAGGSKLKTVHTNADADREAREAERTQDREAREARVRAATQYSTELSDRNIALKLLAMQTLRGVTVELLEDTMRAVGIDIPDLDEEGYTAEDYRETEARLIEVLLDSKVTQLWRAAVLVTTAGLVSHRHSQDPMGAELLKLTGLEGPNQ